MRLDDVPAQLVDELLTTSIVGVTSKLSTSVILPAEGPRQIYFSTKL
jgi:hypothetical protein